MGRTYQFVVGSAEAGQRLDRYLARHLPASVSRSMIQRGIREGTVTVGDRPVKPHDKVRPSDVVTARFDHLPPPPRDLDMAAQDIPLDVAYEDADLLVVNKPPGLVTHPAPGHWDGTLVNAILWHLGQEIGDRRRETGDKRPGTCPLSPVPCLLSQPPRAGIVHRLDKDTSGLLLVAKTPQALASLSKQLKARTLRRRYLALVEGHLPLDTGTVNVPLGRHMTHRKEMTIRHLGGRVAITHYRILKRATFSQGQGAGDGGQGNLVFPRPTPHAPFPFSVVEVSLETGRTHQIRVHMAHIGHPVVGDTTYGRHPASFWQSLGINRQLLHAYSVSFQHPVSGRPLTVTAPVPADMAQWGGQVDKDVIQ